jgi:hypothetical protein
MESVTSSSAASASLVNAEDYYFNILAKDVVHEPQQLEQQDNPRPMSPEEKRFEVLKPALIVTDEVLVQHVIPVMQVYQPEIDEEPKSPYESSYYSSEEEDDCPSQVCEDTPDFFQSSKEFTDQEMREIFIRMNQMLDGTFRLPKYYRNTPWITPKGRKNIEGLKFFGEETMDAKLRTIILSGESLSCCRHLIYNLSFVLWNIKYLEDFFSVLDAKCSQLTHYPALVRLVSHCVYPQREDSEQKAIAVVLSAIYQLKVNNFASLRVPSLNGHSNDSHTKESKNHSKYQKMLSGKY